MIFCICIDLLLQHQVLAVHGLILNAQHLAVIYGIIVQEYVAVVVLQMQRGRCLGQQLTRLNEAVALKVPAAYLLGVVPLGDGLDFEIVTPFGALIAILWELKQRQLDMLHATDDATRRLGGQMSGADVLATVSLSVREIQRVTPLMQQQGI